MPHVQVIGSTRASVGVAATVVRVREALAAAGVPVRSGGPAQPDDRLLVVDPAAWFAQAERPPSQAVLAGAVGFSLAAYGTVRMQDDAAIGRLLAAIAHPDERCVAHLRRLGCTALHVPLGIRPAESHPEDESPVRDVAVMSLGPATPRRLRLLAAGADDLDNVAVAHLFTDASTSRVFGDRPLARATVFLDVGAEDDPSPSTALLLEATEAGAAIVSERLGLWPTDAVVVTPPRTLFTRARDLAADPPRAAALAAAARVALEATCTLDAMGQRLDALLDAGATPGDPLVTAQRPAPALSPGAGPEKPRSIATIIRDEALRADAAVLSGLDQALRAVKALAARVERLETRDERGDVDVLHAAAPTEDAPRVSILVPAHSAARTLTDTLDSVLAAAAESGAPSLEVIVVDDASPGPDAELAAAWAREHAELPVTVLRHPRNRGLSAARNTALERATGAYVLPLDADDLLRPNGLARLLEGLEADAEAVFAYGILERFDATGPIGLVGLYPWAPERLRTGNYIPALALIRREALVELGGYADMVWGYEDWDLWCRVAEAGLHGVWVPQIVARYRTRPNSMSANLHLSHVAPLADMLERHPVLLA